MKQLKYLILLSLAALAASCIKNELPYPVEEIRILSFEGKGFTVGAGDIDPVSRTVTLRLDEATDISAVEVTSVTITENGVSSEPLTGIFDMRLPRVVTLSRYQEYVWTITAQQNIERYFTVEGQVGTAEIDPEKHEAVAYVPEGTDLHHIVVTSLKLGPAGITRMNPALDELTDFSAADHLRYVYLDYHDIVQERWSLYVLETDVKVQLTQVDVWERVAWLTAAAEAGSEVGFRYRQSGSETWIEVPQSAITVTGGSFSARVTGLQPQTSYEFVAVSNGELSAVVTPQPTGTVIDLPNSGFEEWCTEKDILYPYPTPAAAFWGTGNPGANIANATLTEGIPDPRPGSSGRLAARLTSKFANVVGIGKFAAGNLFIGSYARNDGTHGIVDFGRPFTAHPAALHGWLKYNIGTIDRVGTGAQPAGQHLQVGDPDCGMIYIALGDWDPALYGGTAESPVEIRTREIEKTAFNPDSDAVIAYAEMPLTGSCDEWTEFTLPLVYRSTSRKPTHLIIVCSSSRYGDYFTGSTQSVLWLDDFELLWE